MERSRFLALYLALTLMILSTAAFAAPATKIYVGSKWKTAGKVNPQDPLPQLVQTTTIKASTKIFNLLCLAPIKGLKVHDFKWQVWDEKGNAIDEFTLQPKKGSPYAFAEFKIAAAGTYTIAFLNMDDTSTPLATIKITATDTGEVKKGGADVAGTVKTGGAKLTICKSVDDNWNAVGAATTWPSGSTFNILVVSPTPMNVDFIGIVIFKQGEDGKDESFVNEWQQQLEPPTSRKWASVDGLTSLSAGTYSVYVIDWRKRDVTERKGNYPEYFAKVKLTVTDQ